MPQWLMREYLSKRGASFKPEQLLPARLPLLGYCLENLEFEGQHISRAFLMPERQPEIGLEGYDKGAVQLTDFVKSELVKFDTPELDPLGKKIVDCCYRDALLDEYVDLIPIRF